MNGNLCDKKTTAVLVLEDGTRFEGRKFGSPIHTSGEIGNWKFENKSCSCDSDDFDSQCFKLEWSDTPKH